MRLYEVLNEINKDGKEVKPGETIEISDRDLATKLKARGFIKELKHEPVKTKVLKDKPVKTK